MFKADFIISISSYYRCQPSILFKKIKHSVISLLEGAITDSRKSTLYIYIYFLKKNCGAKGRVHYLPNNEKEQEREREHKENVKKMNEPLKIEHTSKIQRKVKGTKNICCSPDNHIISFSS